MCRVRLRSFFILDPVRQATRQLLPIRPGLYDSDKRQLDIRLTSNNWASSKVEDNQIVRVGGVWKEKMEGWEDRGNGKEVPNLGHW